MHLYYVIRLTLHFILIIELINTILCAYQKTGFRYIFVIVNGNLANVKINLCRPPISVTSNVYFGLLV